MLDRYNIHDIVLSFLVGCLACLSLASVNNADGEYLFYVFYFSELVIFKQSIWHQEQSA